jgi:hypothetical protein
MSEFNEWELSSGLPLADAEVEIVGFEFGFNNDIAAGQLFANVSFTDADGETHDQSFSVGQGWASTNKGAELVAENGKPKKFSKNSNFGRLVYSAIEAVGGIEKVGEALGHGPRFAASWIGTKWRTGTVEVEVTKNGEKDGEKIKRDRIIFTEFLGREGAAPAAGGKKEKATAGAAAKSETLGLAQELFDQLIELAKGSADHDAFMDAALELDGVQGVKEVEKLVMSTKAGASIWSAAGH